MKMVDPFPTELLALKCRNDKKSTLYTNWKYPISYKNKSYLQNYVSTFSFSLTIGIQRSNNTLLFTENLL